MLPQLARQGIRLPRTSFPESLLCSYFHTSLTLTKDTSSKSTNTSFQPKRPVSKSYRPIKPRRQTPNTSTLFDPSPHAKHKYIIEDGLPPNYQAEIRQMQLDHKRGHKPNAEYLLRYADLLTAKPGTTEESMLQRRVMNEAFQDPKEQTEFLQYLENVVQKSLEEDFEIGKGMFPPNNTVRPGDTTKVSIEKIHQEMDLPEDPRSEIPIRHNWSETVVRMDRVQKVQRGGTMVRYRCLVIGGNLRGVAGFGVGKASEPKEATEAASRMCRRNIFFVDGYQNSGLTTDLVGKHNSCIVRLRSTPKNRGLKGHPLIRDILLYFGITDCSAKSHGNRNIYNVVYATFKAIMTHRSIEQISRVRGKRFLAMDKAKRISLK